MSSTTPNDQRRKSEPLDQDLPGSKRLKPDLDGTIPQKKSSNESVGQEIAGNDPAKASEVFATCPKHPHVRWKVLPPETDQRDVYSFSATECPRCQQENAWVLIESMEKLNLQDGDETHGATLEEFWKMIQDSLDALETEGEGSSWCLVDERSIGFSPVKSLGVMADALAQINKQSAENVAATGECVERGEGCVQEMDNSVSPRKPPLQKMAVSIVHWMKKAATSNQKSAEDEELLFVACRALSNLAYPKRHGAFCFGEENGKGSESNEWNFSDSSSDEASRAIIEVEGVEILCRLVQSLDDWTARVCEKALSALLNLTISQSAGTAILEANMIQCIIDLLSQDAYQSNPKIQEYGLAGLSQLLILENQRQLPSEESKAMHQRQALERFHSIATLLIQTMNTHSNTVNVQARACAVVIPLFDKLPLDAELWKEQEAVDQPQDWGQRVSEIIRLVIKTLQNYCSDSTAYHCAIVALQNLSSLEMPPQQSASICSSVMLLNDAANTSLTELQNVEIGSKTTKPLHELPGVQLQHSIFALANMSLDLIELNPLERHDQFLALIETCAEVLALLMKCPPHDLLGVSERNFKRIQDACLAALSRLASLSANRSMIISAMNGKCIDICVDTMKHRMNHLGVAKNGVALLGNLSVPGNSQSGKILECNGIEAILHAMQTHENDVELQVFSTGALHNLLDQTQAKPKLLEKFSTQGDFNNREIQGYKIICSIMSKHSTNVQIQIRGCGCLLKMSKGGKDAMSEQDFQEIVMYTRTVIQMHPQNTKVICQTFKLYGQLCKFSSGREALSRCLRVIVTALARLAGQNTEESNSAALFLANACVSTKVAQIMLNQDGVSSLVSAVKTHAFNGDEASSESTLLYVAVALRNLRNHPKWDELITAESSGLMQELDRCLMSHWQSSDKKQEKTLKAVANIFILLSDLAATARATKWNPKLSSVECVANILLHNNLIPSNTSDSFFQPGLKFLASLPTSSSIDLVELKKAGVIRCIMQSRLSVQCWHPLCCAMNNYVRDPECLKEMESGQLVLKLLALLQMIRFDKDAVRIVLQATTNVLEKAKEFDAELYKKMKNEYREGNGIDLIRDVTDGYLLVPTVTPTAKKLLSLLQEDA